MQKNLGYFGKWSVTIIGYFHVESISIFMQASRSTKLVNKMFKQGPLYLQVHALSVQII